MSTALPPLPDHPEPRIMTWSELERQAIKAYGEECARAIEAELDSLRAVNAELMEALKDAATSLETINRLAGKSSYGVNEDGPIPTCMGHHDEVRAYAGARAGVARAAITDPSAQVAVSAISFWEIAIKTALGKLALQGATPETLVDAAQQQGFDLLPLDPRLAASFTRLPVDPQHRDPVGVLGW